MNEDFQEPWAEQLALAGEQDAGASTSTSTSAALAAPLKQIVTIRLDVDMLNWFKSGGPGYQTRINHVLRAHMAEQRAEAEHATDGLNRN